MSIKLKPYKKLRRYTKKTPQFGGADPPIKYAVTGKGNFIEGLAPFLANGTTPTGTKTVKVTIPKDNKDTLKTVLNADGYKFKETGMPGCRNCDREVTTPLKEYFRDKKYTDISLNVGPVLSAVLDVEIDPNQKQAFEEYASKNKLDVKTSTGISVTLDDTSYSINTSKSVTISQDIGTPLQQLKTILVTVPKAKKSVFENAVKVKANEGYSCKNTDSLISRGERSNYELTLPVNEAPTTVFNGIDIQEGVVLRYTTVVRVTNLSKFKKFAKSNDYVVKDSKGKDVKLNDQEYSVVAKRLIEPKEVEGIEQSTNLKAVSFGMKVEASRSKTEEDVTKLIQDSNGTLKVICKKVGMMCGPKNCDYDVTFYDLPENSDDDVDLVVPVLPKEGGVTLTSMRVNFQVSTDEQLRKLKYHISKNKSVFELIDSNGKTVKLEDKDSEELLDTYTAITSKYIISFKITDEPDYENYVNDIREKLKTKDPNVGVEIEQEKQGEKDSIAVITSLTHDDVNTVANEVTKKKYYSITQADQTPPSFDELVQKGLSSSEQEFKYDENEFEKVYTELVDNNPKMKTSDGTLMIKKPTELKDKMVLFSLLMNIKALVRGTREGVPDAIETQRSKVKTLKKINHHNLKEEETKLLEMEKASLLTQRSYVATFFSSVNELRQKAKGDLTPNALKDTPAANFFKRLYDIEKPVGWLQGKLNHAARVIPIIASIRNYYKGLNTISFDSKMIGEEALQQQRRDIARGIENEFAIMSAFVGTKSQKVAGKTALIAAAASGLWALYANIQKNPETAAMLATVVAGCGPQAIAAAGILALAVASYYVYLKIQDKYAKYFILIRTMNEFMIVLNKIERLVRLSMNISRHYQFNVNLKDIEAQLKILFDRFNKMLSEDDVSQIEQNMKSQSKLPDFGEAAADAESNAEQAAAKALEEDAKSNKDQGGGGFGDFIFRVTFDVELWNQKLNDDVVKLNLHFTTAMAEFSMVLNVIQIDLLTSEEPSKRKVIKTANDAVTASTEYRKMIIGILLNDILKLRVDYSYCNRGGYLTNTKSEGVCTDVENLDIDPVGNKRSKFKEKLHGLIKHLAEILNHPTCPYPPDVKERIKKAVIAPYVQMLKDAKPQLGKGNTFYLTDGATLSPEDIEKAKTDAINALNLGTLAHPQPIKGGQWYKFNSKAVDTKPSLERDITILQELKTRAYDFVSHEALMQFLMGVDKFVKAEGEPTTAEKKEAEEVAKEIVQDAKISQVVTSDLAEAQKRQDEEQLAEAQQTQNEEQLAEDQKKQNEQKLEKDQQTQNDQNDGGGRRLTRKRIFKPKKNRRVSRTHEHFKSAADALKAFRRK